MAALPLDRTKTKVDHEFQTLDCGLEAQWFGRRFLDLCFAFFDKL